MREMLKNAGILLAITVIAGFILGAVYQITKGPIAQAEAAAAMEAYKEVFADAADFTEVEEYWDSDWNDNEPQEFKVKKRKSKQKIVKISDFTR